MGTLFSALDIARAGLNTAQIQLDTAGHNIANVNTEGFTRQRVDVTARLPLFRPYGAIGRGPAVVGVERLRDAFLDQVYREQTPGLGSAEIQATYFARLEDVFQEPSDTGFGARLNRFFDAIADFSNNVESIPARTALMAEAQAVAASLNEADRRINTLRSQANEEIRATVPEINSLAQRIAASNDAIRRAEATGQSANDLRDGRDRLIDDLSRLVRISYSERDDGQINVLLGDEELVSGTLVRNLETFIDPSIDPERPDLLNLRFDDTNEIAQITDGELYGLFEMRDVQLREVQTEVDTLAQGIIRRINEIHAQGRGLERIGEAITSDNAITLSFFAPLNTAGLPFPVRDGNVQVLVYDSAGALQSNLTIPIVASGPGATTVADLQAAINGATTLNVSLDASNGRMTITPPAGSTFHFANDTSGVLAALGLNGMFTGVDAGTIGVNDRLVENPAQVSSGGYDPAGAALPDPDAAGDNTAALALASVRNERLLTNGQQTVNEFYSSLIAEIGVRARSNDATLQVEESFVNDFARRRQEVSGVNLDEEVTSLLQYQRAFEGSARVITVTDRMLDALLNLVQ